MISRRDLFTGLGMAPLATIAAGDRSTERASPAPARSFVRRSGRDMLRQRYFPNVELTTSEGRTVRFYDDLLRDKIVVINLMYADCDGICPTATANLKRVRTLLRQQVTEAVFF